MQKHKSSRVRLSKWLWLVLSFAMLTAAYAASLPKATLVPLADESESSNDAAAVVRGSSSLIKSGGGTTSTPLRENRLTTPGTTSLSKKPVLSDSGDSATATETVKTPTLRNSLSVSPSTLSIQVGQSSNLTVSNASGKVTVSTGSSEISVKLNGTTITVTGLAAGVATMTIKDSKSVVALSVTVTAVTPPPVSTTGTYTLTAWNDLGMHCMDADYSVFSILPPYNNLHAQLVNNSTGKLVTSGVNLTYEAVHDPYGSINTSSATKTNFWTYVLKLFGVQVPEETGLAGNKMPQGVPQPMQFDAGQAMFKAEGIPITPIDDFGKKNTYPMVKVVARDGTGKQLATASVVLPVSDEMTCKACHATNASAAARPASGWVTGQTPEREYRLNILRLHDEKSGTDLYSKAMAGTPTLCASCHGTNALGLPGVAGRKPLTESMHATHATVVDPKNGLKLDDTANRSACYQCHPGSETKCLRGAMSGTDMQCQSCHGKMTNVGTHGRVGWLDEPNCQACHYDGQRQLTALQNGVLRKPADTRFATNPNTPQTGFSLFRFSKGHGGLQCEACHGATHAEYASAPPDPNLPGNHYNDNVLSIGIQGHAGVISDCKACHKTVPLTSNGGPHGLHTVGQAWVKGHESSAKSNRTACAYCHGADFRGGPLATVKTSQTFTVEGRTKSYAAGQTVGCYDCHNGPNGG